MKETYREAWASLRGRHVQLAQLWLIGCLTLASYAVTRPASESIFLLAYSSTALPYAWLCVALAAAAVVAVYNRLASRWPVAKLLSAAIAVSALLLAASWGAVSAGAPGAALVLYVWKDLYVIILVETFWTYADCVFSVRAARLLYGGLLIAGTSGGVCGNLLVGALATRFGTTASLAASVAMLALAFVFALRLAGHAGPAPARESPKAGWRSTVALFARSRYLGLLLALVVVVQIVLTLIDYEFNRALERAVPDTDLRTRTIGQVYAVTELLAFALQAASGLVLRAVGITYTLLLIPGLLAGAILGAVALPGLGSIALVKVTSKCFDYSLFRAAREVLYIPLSYAEKTQGKACIDIFSYRAAKGLASVVLLALVGGAAVLVPYLALALIALWLVLAWGLGRRWHDSGQPEAAELGAVRPTQSVTGPREQVERA